MFEINKKSTVGIFKANQIKGQLPVSKLEYDMFKIYFIGNNIQQCECYSSKTKELKVYRRLLLDISEFTSWQEVVPWYKSL